MDDRIDTRAVRIAGVKYPGEYLLRLRWTNGSNLTVDLARPVQQLKGLRPLRDPDVFALAARGAGGHSVAWPRGLDMGADRPWEMGLGQNGLHDTGELTRWRRRHGLSLSAAAAALGLSRRQIAYYAGGKHRVPRTVLLACKGWEAEQEAATRAAA